MAEETTRNNAQVENCDTYTGMPLIGDKAPAFRAMTTMGKCNFPDDYKGKWVVFFSHPADFTPVCTTEFVALARRAEEFRALNAELLGLSIDSLHSHLAWAESIEHIDLGGKGKVEIPFPIVADISMKVAKLYGIPLSAPFSFILCPQGAISTRSSVSSSRSRSMMPITYRRRRTGIPAMMWCFRLR